MKKTVSAALCAALIFALAGFASAIDIAPEVSAQAAIVMCVDTGDVLYEKNADAAMLIASTTKIMTALVVLNNCQPDEQVEILPEYTAVEGSSMYLAAGETYTVEELLYGLMLASGNDAAVALACHTAGSIENFALMMNETARELGLVNSSFKNPHGLDEDGHYSCARDLAVIMCAALEDELFREIISTESYTCKEQTYVNHNRLLWSCEGVFGGKTGYTIAAGRSLVSCCERDGMRLICVTLSDPDDWNDHARLYDWGYDNFEYTDPLGSFARISVPVVSGDRERVTVVQNGGFKVFRAKDAEVKLDVQVPSFVFAPVSAGESAGKIDVYINGTLASTAQMCYLESSGLDKSAALTGWEQFKRLWYMSMRYGYTLPY